MLALAALEAAWRTTVAGPAAPVSGRRTLRTSRTARARFHDVLAEFTARLQFEPMRRETAVALVQQMDQPARMASEDDAVRGRAIDLQAASTR